MIMHIGTQLELHLALVYFLNHLENTFLQSSHKR